MEYQFIFQQFPKIENCTMFEDRLLDTKRTLRRLADQTGKSMEDVLKLLRQENQLGPLESKISLVQSGQLTKGDQMGKMLEMALQLVQESILDLNRASTRIMENVVEQMVTKKIYKIRQSFRELILSVLGVKQAAIYISQERGRVQFQDFSTNFITQIMEEDHKSSLFQKVVQVASSQLNFVDLSENSDLIKLFELNSIEKNCYFGAIGCTRSSERDTNLTFIMMVKCDKSQIQKLTPILTAKFISKMIQICQISVYEGNFYQMQQILLLRSKIYAKEMLDLLEIVIIHYDSRLKKFLCQLCRLSQQSYLGLTNISKVIISKMDENLANQQSTLALRRLISQFQQMEYKKIQEIRVYKKYIRQPNTILLQFNRIGVLLFISGNRDHPHLNDLTMIWEEGKPCLDQILGKNQKFQGYVKKAVRGSLKTSRPLEIDEEVKVKITTNSKKIQKIHIIITQNEVIGGQKQNGETLKRAQSQKRNIIGANNALTDIQKQNPGIMASGWIDLFLKGNTDKTQKQKDGAFKKNNTFAFSQVPSQKGKRQLSLVESKQEFWVSIQDIAIDNLNINLLNFNDSELEKFSIKVLDSLDYFQRLPQERERLTNFIRDLQDNYEVHSNPFHNFRHGVNVMHSVYLLSTMTANINILTAKDIFVNVFSGLCHDVGHTGFTNAFEIASMSRKALIYNDRSPLENFHASLTFELLRKQQNNFLCHMERDQFAKFRKAVIQNILYTDIKEHFPLLNSFNQLLKSGKVLGRQDASLLSYIILHSSDFAGSAKQFQICKQWSRRVNLQFSNQYRMEGEIGIPQTPFMKDLTNPVVLSKAEGGFLRVIVYPLYQALDAYYLTEGIVHKMKKNIQENMKGWEEINRLETEKAKSEKIDP